MYRAHRRGEASDDFCFGSCRYIGRHDATAMLWPPSTKVSAGTACGEVPVMVALRLFLPDCIEPFRLNVRCALLGAAAKDNPMHARR